MDIGGGGMCAFIHPRAEEGGLIVLEEMRRGRKSFPLPPRVLLLLFFLHKSVYAPFFQPPGPRSQREACHCPGW